MPEQLGDKESDAILLSGEGWGVCMGVLASHIWLCFLARWEGERACPRVEVGKWDRRLFIGHCLYYASVPTVAFEMAWREGKWRLMGVNLSGVTQLTRCLKRLIPRSVQCWC